MRTLEHLLMMWFGHGHLNEDKGQECKHTCLDKAYEYLVAQNRHRQDERHKEEADRQERLSGKDIPEETKREGNDTANLRDEFNDTNDKCQR